MSNKEIWFFLFFFGVLLFNWPFLEVFALSLPYYLFIIWGVFIIVVIVVIKKMNKQSSWRV
ncbi:MAG TPA: hypothetical protein VLD55_10240 [Candidatus Sulfobium mesophilum]|jgi:hypothetical protein|uniref:Uncharacterized protein n=1 Tax=Candidatus Sulfobium mesophilum TaxID=2016548 RepID=A0A2U3QFY2_9BACT|nr:hypothetical protein NBG4_20055 [Candidatus Sulfobium mesophilum]HSB31972.1 hypothetical protein [Candidatus Sulfobium mesophilum]